MSNHFDVPAFKAKLSDSFHDYQMPDHYLVTSEKEHDENPAQIRKNIIIPQPQQIGQLKFKQLQDQQNFINLMGFMPLVINYIIWNNQLQLNTTQEAGMRKTNSNQFLSSELFDGAMQHIKKEERGMVKNESSTSLKDDMGGLQNIKGNVKNAYIKKINSLLNVTQEDDKDRLKSLKMQAFDQNSSMSSNNLNANNPNEKISGENEEIKMQKNRESARNSRQRKKLYIGLLEKKVEDLNSQIDALRQQTDISFKHIHGIIEQNPCLKGMIIDQAQLYDHMQEKLGSEQMPQEGTEMVQLLTDSYKLRYSSTGQMRKQYIKYCFQNIAKAFLEGNYGHLLFGSSHINKNFALLDDDEFNNFVQHLKEVTGLMEDNQQYKILGVVRKMIEHKKNQKYLIKQLRRLLKDIRSKQQNFEDVMDEILGQLTPQQFGQYLIQISKVIVRVFIRLKQKSDDMYLKEEYNQPQDMNRIKSEHMMTPLTHQLLNQLQLELLLKNQQINQASNLMMGNHLLLDPMSINDMIQKKYCINK